MAPVLPPRGALLLVALVRLLDAVARWLRSLVPVAILAVFASGYAVVRTGPLSLRIAEQSAE